MGREGFFFKRIRSLEKKNDFGATYQRFLDPLKYKDVKKTEALLNEIYRTHPQYVWCKGCSQPVASKKEDVQETFEVPQFKNYEIALAQQLRRICNEQSTDAAAPNDKKQKIKCPRCLSTSGQHQRRRVGLLLKNCDTPCSKGCRRKVSLNGLTLPHNDWCNRGSHADMWPGNTARELFNATGRLNAEIRKREKAIQNARNNMKFESDTERLHHEKLLKEARLQQERLVIQSVGKVQVESKSIANNGPVNSF